MATFGRCVSRSPFGALLGVKALCELLGRFAEMLRLLLDKLLVIARHRLFKRFDGGVDLALFSGLDTLAKLADRLLSGMNQAIGLVSGLNQLMELFIFLGMKLSILNHPFDFFIAEAA